uniref:YopX protein n=1 Tax=viral metagenome TaxID=1070528 RepID=A0A6M3ISI5_9ZZZZ
MKQWLCTKDFVMNDGDITFTTGKIYEEVEIHGNRLIFRNDDGDIHWMNPNSEYFPLHFTEYGIFDFSDIKKLFDDIIK